MMRRMKCKHYLVIVIALALILDYCGLFRYVRQQSYHSEFSYPYDGDVSKWREMLKAGQTPPVPPEYSHEYFLSRNPRDKCLSSDGSHYEQLREGSISFSISSVI